MVARAVICKKTNCSRNIIVYSHIPISRDAGSVPASFLFLPLVRHIRVFYRLVFFSLYTARIVLEVYVRRVWLRQPLPAVMAVRRRWARRVLYGVGVRIRTTGCPPGIPCLVVSNHRSYLDPIILLRDIDGFPVAKAELADWPLIGKGAHWAGILYVRRDTGGSRTSILRAISDLIIRQNIPVILFPEGTTSDLPGTLPFQKGAFRTASKMSIPVVPVAISFEDRRNFWVGDVSFIKHAWQAFLHSEIAVQVHYGPVLQYSESDMLEQEARAWIEMKLLAETQTAEIR